MCIYLQSPRREGEGKEEGKREEGERGRERGRRERGRERGRRGRREREPSPIMNVIGDHYKCPVILKPVCLHTCRKCWIGIPGRQQNLNHFK